MIKGKRLCDTLDLICVQNTTAKYRYRCLDEYLKSLGLVLSVDKVISINFSKWIIVLKSIHFPNIAIVTLAVIFARLTKDYLTY